MRANNAESRNKDLIIQVGEEKGLRAVVVQEKGELVDLLENAQRLREEAEEQLKIRMEELATQTEKLRRAEEGVAVDSGVPVCVTVYTQTDAVVVGPTSSDAVVESETEVMGRLDIQTVEFATQTEAATETSASGVERECRHEVEVQNLKRDLEVAEKDYTFLEKINAKLENDKLTLLHKIKEMCSVRPLTDARSVRNNSVRKRDGWKKR